MHLKQSRMVIFINEHEKQKKHLHGGILTENDFGQQNSAFGILSRLVIVHRHGTISRLWQGISRIAFISQPLKHVKMFITPFSLMNSTILLVNDCRGLCFSFFQNG